MNFPLSGEKSNFESWSILALKIETGSLSILSDQEADSELLLQS